MKTGNYRSVIILILFCVSLTGRSQKEGLIWYFGDFAGLDFSNGQPQTLDNGALYTIEGCATISGKQGNLLFYTDGIEVYNRAHHRMPNGNGLYGDPSATQSGVIVPIPNDSLRYYVFTVDNDMEEHGLCYSVVNLSLAGGMGDVEPANKNINLMAVSTERITSVNHRNEFGIWVIVHEWGNKRFRSYLVTDQGLQSQYVITDIGLSHSGDDNNGKGYMKVSPGGEKVAVAIQGMDMVQVFDFNNATGKLSEPITLNNVTSAYGVEFSMEARFLYASERYGANIHQWDLEAGSPQEVMDSHAIVGILGYDGGGAMQLGSDGRIYIARKSKRYLSVINEPWEPGGACGFADIGISLGERASKEGLPTFIQSYFNFYWFNAKNFCFGDTTFFTLNKTTHLDSIHWSFSDPVSGPDSISEVLEPWHVFSSPGIYKVSARLFHVGSYTDLAETIEVIALPDVALGEDQDLCEGETVNLDAGEGFLSYEWNGNPALNGRDIEVTEAGNYVVDVTHVCGTDSDTIRIEFIPLPEVDLGNDTLIRYDSYIVLDAGPGMYAYKWQDGSGNSMYQVDYPGTYTIEIMDEYGCKGSDTINIEPVPFTLNLPDAFTPNGDGANDVFRAIPSYDISLEFHMMIFNRYGEMVFESDNIIDTWDGNYNGYPCPVEAYIWILDARTLEGNEFFRGAVKSSGTVALIR